MKFCSKCNIYKTIDCFSICKSQIDGLYSSCRECRHKYYIDNKTKINEKTKSYYSNNKDKIKINRKQYSQEYNKKNYFKQQQWKKNNKIKDTESKKISYYKNKRKTLDKIKNRRKTDILYKLSLVVRTRLKQFLIRKKFRKIHEFNDYIGCTVDELKHYLETKFQPGMTWENHGLKGWHIDHIIPLSIATSIEDIYKLSHYTNLQPLWAADNLSKGNKI